MTLVKDLGEEGLVRLISRRFAGRHPRLIKSIGDDTSVTVQRSGYALLATTDILIEGVHFRKGYAPPLLLGKKALGISLSDVAAMGGRPLFYLVSIAVPPETPVSFINGLYRGMSLLAVRHGVFLAGGNTARHPDRAVIETTLIGEARKGRVVYRSGAKKGDLIFVTGTLGDAAAGLLELERMGAEALKGATRRLALRHLAPEPRVEAGMELGASALASSMIDLSDGLLLDLKRLCRASGVAAVVEAERLPLSAQFKRREKLLRRTFLPLALSGGEDYELLFTARPGNEGRVMRLARRLRLRITRIGSITGKASGSAASVKLVATNGKTVKTNDTGFLHF